LNPGGRDIKKPFTGLFKRRSDQGRLDVVEDSADQGKASLTRKISLNVK
jgi:hypothetical protein